MIAGLNSATSGVVSYHGQPLTGVNPHTTIVFQTFALYPWLTVQENVEIALKARAAESRTERALKLIDVVGLDGFESAYPCELFGGIDLTLDLPLAKWFVDQRSRMITKAPPKSCAVPLDER